MLRKTGFMCVATLLFALHPAAGEFKRFHALETYEIQPGILMEPTYSSDGRVCRVVLEKRHFSFNVIDLDAKMSREQIDHIFDELVPSKDRGPKTVNGGIEELSTTDAGTRTTLVEYENVSLEMVGKAANTGKQEYVVAIIHWKRRACN